MFDLLGDPHEEANLAGENPEIVEKRAAAIDRWYPVKERKAITSWPQ